MRTFRLPKVGTKRVEKSSAEEAEKEAQKLDEFVKEMPPFMLREMRFMAQLFSGGSGSVLHTLLGKFNESHIDKFLDSLRQDDQNKYKYYSSNRWFHLAYVGIGVSLLVFIFVLFADNQTILSDILKILVAFAGGLGSGYGLRSAKDRR